MYSFSKLRVTYGVSTVGKNTINIVYSIERRVDYLAEQP